MTSAVSLSVQFCRAELNNYQWHPRTIEATIRITSVLYHSVDSVYRDGMYCHSVVTGHSLVVRGIKGTAVIVCLCWPWHYNMLSLLSSVLYMFNLKRDGRDIVIVFHYRLWCGPYVSIQSSRTHHCCAESLTFCVTLHNYAQLAQARPSMFYIRLVIIIIHVYAQSSQYTHFAPRLSLALALRQKVWQLCKFGHLLDLEQPYNTSVDTYSRITPIWMSQRYQPSYLNTLVVI